MKLIKLFTKTFQLLGFYVMEIAVEVASVFIVAMILFLLGKVCDIFSAMSEMIDWLNYNGNFTYVVVTIFTIIILATINRKLTRTILMQIKNNPIRHAGRIVLQGMILAILFNAISMCIYGYEVVEQIAIDVEVILGWLGGIVVAPIVEEYLFRGMYFTSLQEVFSSRTAILISAALFAVFHGLDIGTIFIFIMGVYFAYMYNERKSLLAPIILHITFNFVGTFLYVPI